MALKNESTGPVNVLVIDVGGTNVKLWRTGEADKVKFPSGPEMTPAKMVDEANHHLDGWQFDRVSLGYPGEVANGHPSKEPYNLAEGWVNFDYPQAFGAPVKIMNDACMQALGSYEGGRMLYIGLGTGMGTVYIFEGAIAPLALGHLKFYRGESFDHYLSRKGLELHGPKRWRRAVSEAAITLKAAFLADYVVLGGGNAKHLKELPEGCRRGGNHNAYFGGLKIWEPERVNAPSLTLVSDSIKGAV
ncbi:MAG: ROK family protein [Planctomycetia bacterium]|nr:ROK family protein [Planctomycetia bacterium]